MRNTHVHGESLSQFVVGQRVATSPGTDAFMQGDRYGEVAKIGRLYVSVELDRSGRILPFTPCNLSFMSAD